jgi:5-deoxy-glucuronate isomerase
VNLLIKSPGQAAGFYPLCQRGHQLKHLSFALLQLDASFTEFEWNTGDEEQSLDFYTGAVNLEIHSSTGSVTYSIPARPSIATPHPMVYVPMQSKVLARFVDAPARISIGGALGKPGVPPHLIDGQAIVEKTIGKDNWTRTVFTHIADNIPAAHLICGETVNRPGGWSSCPPHKHDISNPPQEVPMEEIYFFQVAPEQGFGFQRIYTQKHDSDPFDLSFAVEHGDTILIPRGYHPVAACPGYTLNYTWILAGEGRTYGAWADDPAHSWIKG